MNLTDAKYKNFALVQEMLRAPEIIGHFDFGQTRRIVDSIKETNRFFLTGEGSSRIFPAKRFIASLLGRGLNLTTATDGARQALEYDLSAWTVIGASNSGQTKELITLFRKLNTEKHPRLFGLTANAGTMLTEVADSIVLSCGKENAVAATMSVVEQALVYQSIEIGLADCHCGCTERKSNAGQLAAEVLAEEYNTELIKKIANAPVIYLAGRNNGVAEELALKTNEITRKRSQYLEGTIVVHGIEEVMNPEDVVVLIEPFEQDAEFYKKNLIDGVGLTVVAVSSKPTLFETILIPSLPRYNEYFQLLAGWNLLVQTGAACGIDIDKPKRARKIGNAF
ncbi:MAG: sugar isomerase [Planctomycetaceae bacterium]|jgi:glucosamine--fructose-6-phosphate aminotransferase (isomerizing)|nr:sugar isomerase [Planctomycetaceae bacterium]